MPLSFVSIQLDTARVELVGPACGGLRRGEIPETAARGELAEEIGLRPSVHFYFIGRDDDLREFERVMQGGPIRNRTRHLLGENLFAPCFGQRVALQGKILVYGRNSGVADQHRFRSFD